MPEHMLVKLLDKKKKYIGAKRLGLLEWGAPKQASTFSSAIFSPKSQKPNMSSSGELMCDGEAFHQGPEGPPGRGKSEKQQLVYNQAPQKGQSL